MRLSNNIHGIEVTTTQFYGDRKREAVS